MIYGDDQEPKPLELSHQPFRRPRTDFTGECMFASSWLRLMASPAVEDDNNRRGVSTKLELILSVYPHEITQRTASIAASFITWLGTNMGMCFLGEAVKISEKLGNRQDGFISAWAITNRRMQGIDQGVRAIEAILREEDYGQSHDLFSYRRPNAPLLTAADTEVVDHLVEWLAEEEGMEFVRKCEFEITSLKDAQSYEAAKKTRRELEKHENLEKYPNVEREYAK